MDNTQHNDRWVLQLEDALNLFKSTNFNATKFDAMIKKTEKFTLMLILDLSKNQQVTTSMVADKLGVTLAAVSHHINSLVEEGYIERQISPDDRRVIFLNLTKKGMTFVLELKKKHHQKINALAQYLGKDDTQKIIDLLKKINNFIQINRREENA